jgi:GNAT superfamily N-acetyltransferase
VKPIELPPGMRVERLDRRHDRRAFRSGESRVDDWLATKALQHQEKSLSVSKVLLDATARIVGFYTLATSQIDFGELPVDIRQTLPKRALPVAVLAWFGIAEEHQGLGLGSRLLALALRDCWEAGKTFAFVAVVLDCLTDSAKSFYERWDFAELPGHKRRLYLTSRRLAALMEGNDRQEHGR